MGQVEIAGIFHFSGRPSLFFPSTGPLRRLLQPYDLEAEGNCIWKTVGKEAGVMGLNYFHKFCMFPFYEDGWISLFVVARRIASDFTKTNEQSKRNYYSGAKLKVDHYVLELHYPCSRKFTMAKLVNRSW